MAPRLDKEDQPGRLQEIGIVAAAIVAVLGAGPASGAEDASVEERLRRLEQRQAEVERALEAREARIQELEAELARRPQVEMPSAAEPVPARAPDGSAVTPAAITASTMAEGDDVFGMFTPGRGFTVARTDWGEIQLSIYSYLRYLNQKALDDTFVNHLGETRNVDIRNDFEVNKVFLYTQGWFLDPKLRYTFYVWGSGPLIGTSTGILLAGNLTYAFNDALTVGGGVLALPSTRSMDGQFPLWDRVDARLIADEFMRGSFTQGIWANGKLTSTLGYKIGLGNNLNGFGANAPRLDDRMDTWAAALTWMPTTGEFGTRGAFGDFDRSTRLATLFSARFTSSTEDRESQPGAINPENTQLRLSDGTTVFTANALAPDVTVDRLDYRMASVSGGMKYRGFYLEAEAYRRWLDDFRTSGTGTLPMRKLVDTGMQVQGSYMLVPSTFQAYAGASKIWGEFGDPWDAAVGVNWWPWHKRGFRINTELLRIENSPVGSITLPYPVGGSGWVFTTNAELSF